MQRITIVLPTFIPSSTTGYDVLDSGMYYLASGSTLSNNNGFALTAVAPAAAGMGLTVAGTIKSSYVAATLQSDGAVGDHVHITSQGLIEGQDGILIFKGLDNTIVNDGLVKATENAIDFDAVDTTIVNNGTLKGPYGIYGDGDGNVVYNHGTIDGSVGFLTKAGETSKFVNSGLLDSPGWAFSSQGGSDTVINSGKINGDVQLEGGDDVFTNAGGTVAGSVHGGEGDDIYIMNDKLFAVVENANEGWDLEKSSVSFTLADNVEEGILTGKQNIGVAGTKGTDLLYGNKGDNHITGNGGADHIIGGGGNDILTGDVKGDGGDFASDVFIFKPNSGHDTITDFEVSYDVINLGSYGGFGSFADLKSHIHQTGSDVVIDLSNGDTITLQNVEKGALHAGDFTF